MRKVVLVTGSSNGLGKDIIRIFASNDYDVVITYYSDEESALELAKEVEKYNVASLVLKCDISNEENVINVVDTIIKRFGKIDVLVNNAAIEESSDFFKKSYDSFNRILSVNLIGTFLVSREVGKYMLKDKSGKIVNISSNNSINAYDPSTLEYDISKVGINLLTKELAKEFSPYVNVNAIAPGWIMTDKVEKLNDELSNKLVEEESSKILTGKFSSTTDIANLVLFLSSDKSSSINGEIIVIDGGYLS